MKRATILFQLDPSLVPHSLEDRYRQFERPLRLLPAKGGVALRRGRKAQVFATPEDMAAHLHALGFVHDHRARELGGDLTATGQYYADGAAFLQCAARAVLETPEIRRIWVGEEK